MDCRSVTPQTDPVWMFKVIKPEDVWCFTVICIIFLEFSRLQRSYVVVVSYVPWAASSTNESFQKVTLNHRLFMNSQRYVTNTNHLSLLLSFNSFTNHLPVRLFIQTAYTEQSQTPSHKSIWALRNSRMNAKERGVDTIIWITKEKQQPERRKEWDRQRGECTFSDNRFNGQRRSGGACSGESSHCLAANFSLLVKSLQSQGRESLLLRGEARHQKQCNPV